MSAQDGREGGPSYLDLNVVVFQHLELLSIFILLAPC